MADAEPSPMETKGGDLEKKEGRHCPLSSLCYQSSSVQLHTFLRDCLELNNDYVERRLHQTTITLNDDYVGQRGVWLAVVQSDYKQQRR